MWNLDDAPTATSINLNRYCACVMSDPVSRIAADYNRATGAICIHILDMLLFPGDSESSSGVENRLGLAVMTDSPSLSVLSSPILC